MSYIQDHQQQRQQSTTQLTFDSTNLDDQSGQINQEHLLALQLNLQNEELRSFAQEASRWKDEDISPSNKKVEQKKIRTITLSQRINTMEQLNLDELLDNIDDKKSSLNTMIYNSNRYTWMRYSHILRV